MRIEIKGHTIPKGTLTTGDVIVVNNYGITIIKKHTNAN